MNRRRFLSGVLAAAGLGLAVGCARTDPSPPDPAKVRTIGFLFGSPSKSPANVEQQAAFRETLRGLGYVEGQNLLFEERGGDGDDDLAAPAAELVRLRPSVIVVISVTAARAVRDATDTTPIVSAGIGDLVASGLAASYARPGGNVTGLSTPALTGKQLELFREAVPSLTRAAVLLDASLERARRTNREAYEAAAGRLGLQLRYLETEGPEDLGAVFEAMAREQADGLLVTNGPVLTTHQARIAELAVQGRLPSMWQSTDAVARGGLVAYGQNRVELYRRAAIYGDKILKSAKPSELPIEQPTAFDFPVNLATARALGLTIPATVLQRATEVIG